MTGTIILACVYAALIGFMVDAWVQERRHDD